MRLPAFVALLISTACGTGGTNRHSAASGPGPQGPATTETATTSTTARSGACFNIVNGQDTGLYPFVGLIVTVKPDGSLRDQCTGSFIAPNMMLTAAHCAPVETDVSYYWIPGSAVTVPASASGNAAFLAGGKKAKSVVVDSTDLRPSGTKESVVQPEIVFRDAAVLVFAENVAPATAELETAAVNDQEDVTLVGYGIVALPGGAAPAAAEAGAIQKREGRNTVFTNEKIKSMLGPTLLVGGEPDAVALGYVNKHSLAGPGDSGGPLLHNGKILGVLSSGARLPVTESYRELVNGQPALNLYGDVRGEAIQKLVARAKGLAGAVTGGPVATDPGTGSAGPGTGSGSSACMTLAD